MQYYQVVFLIVFGSIGIVAASDSSKHQSPLVLNSLPATKIKCRPGAIEGWCAKGFTVKQYEAEQ